MPLSAHIVPHTHWDREWYHPFVRFRQRLVALIDELLDDPPPPGESFLLDGQAIVLEDYLAVRPERTPELARLLREGRLEAGPWYVLGDELIPTGEALVRNLLLGRTVLQALGAGSPPVLYCPDSFGHPAALPALAHGFGLPLIILWRGYGGRRWPAGDLVRWRAPDGTTAPLFHLPPDGYEYGSHLPTELEQARVRWARMRDVLGGRSRTGVVLVQNGADHHARQRQQRPAFAALAAAAADSDDCARGSSLREFAMELQHAAQGVDLPTVEGELRDSYGYTWTLQGTFATRAAQKRRNARAERLLVREAEPWTALVHARGGSSRQPLLRAAWRTLLQAHPHDTLCGCSIDAVAAAMDSRLDDALAQARGLRDDALQELVGHDAVAARQARDRWRPVVIVRNRSPRRREGVAVLQVEQFVADVPVGPGSAPTREPARTVPRLPMLSDGSRLQLLGRHETHDRVESPRDYPDNDLVISSQVAVWVSGVAGYGTTSLAIGDRRARTLDVPHPVRVERCALDNGIVRIEVGTDGRVSVQDRERAHELDSLLTIEDERDLGDLYTPSPRGSASVARFVGSTVMHRGPLVGEIELRWRLAAAGGAVTRGRVVGHLSLRISLRAHQPVVRLRVAGRNLGTDHRLRVGICTGVANAAVWADAAFGPVERAPLRVPEEDRRMETPPPTAPLHRYVSLFAADRGATVYSDGLAEYEATDSGCVFVTLLRAVGELSRNDLPERPGHAGWPASTPGAQSQGPFEAELALLLHEGRTAACIDTIERAADDVLLPLEGSTLRSALSIPEPTVGVELEGQGLAFSALKPSESGEMLVARCANLLDREVDGAWRFGVPITTAFLARLDESTISPLRIEENRVSFRAPSRGIVTVLVR